MFVSGVSSVNTKNLSFNSSSRVVYERGHILRKNYTKLFRDDLNWKEFVQLLGQKYRNESAVNILNCACSDGSESWSLSAMLKHILGQDSTKFSIKASDIDCEILKKAKSGVCSIDESELYKISSEVGHYSEYFAPTVSNDKNYGMALIPKKEIANSVEFYKADVFESLKKLEERNNVVMLRNFWKYMPEFDQRVLARALSDSLDSTSLVVIGELERGNGQDKLLKDAGFIETDVFGVYTKPQQQDIKKSYVPYWINNRIVTLPTQATV